jgi:hypothetical protein
MRSLGPDHPSTQLGVDNLAALEAELRECAAPERPAPAPQPAKRGLLGRLFGGG